MKKIGFTGTSKGMSVSQKNTLKRIFKRSKGFELHHGDCIGADKEAHYIAMKFKDKVIIIKHPPLNSKSRAFCKGGISLMPEEYIKRNHNIVDDVDLLIGAPKTSKEALRSGVWATIRYAKKVGVKIRILN